MSLDTVIHWLLLYKYVIIFPIALIEGPILPIIGGFLLRQEYVQILPLFSVLLIGNLIGDSFWYGVGYRWAHPFIARYGKFLNISEELFLKVQDVFQRRAAYILLLSKITMGFGFALVTLIGAGAAKIPFRKYIVLNAIGGTIWIATAMAVGYFFGHVYLLIEKGFRAVSLVTFVAIVILILARLYKYSRKKILPRL
jgi:membrane protein DedA with SNARE-associated domain